MLAVAAVNEEFFFVVFAWCVNLLDYLLMSLFFSRDANCTLFSRSQHWMYLWITILKNPLCMCISIWISLSSLFRFALIPSPILSLSLFSSVCLCGIVWNTRIRRSIAKRLIKCKCRYSIFQARNRQVHKHAIFNKTQATVATAANVGNWNGKKAILCRQHTHIQKPHIRTLSFYCCTQLHERTRRLPHPRLYTFIWKRTYTRKNIHLSIFFLLLCCIFAVSTLSFYRRPFSHSQRQYFLPIWLHFYLVPLLLLFICMHK